MNGLGLDRDASMQQPLGRREGSVLDRSTVYRRTHTPFSHTPELFRVSGLQQEPGVPRETHIGTGRTCKLNVEGSPRNLEGSHLIRSSSVVMTSS